jgi:polygalacturonase
MPTALHPRRDILRVAAGFFSGAFARSQAAQVRASLPPSAPAAGAGALFVVSSYGARGDGAALDTGAINTAIGAAAAAGGGIVLFPAGNYLSHSIRLKSNVTLQLDPGATIVAADAVSGGPAYDLAEPNPWNMYQDFGHSHFHNSLIWGEGLENIGIVGTGRIWGKGLSRGTGAPNALTPGVGNKSIGLRECHNVLLRDFSILHGGHFGILATGVDNLTIDNLKIDTNRDGMDVDACRNVRISNCYVNSPWDDGICLKADYSLGRAKQTEFVTISDCYVSGCWQEGTLLDGSYRKFDSGVRVSRNGRIKFGTESNGGFRNITISNCVFEGCQGLALETVDGALLEDVTVTNISMRDIVGAPIFMRLGARMRGPDGVPVGTLRRVIVSNLVCSNSESGLGSIISGIPGHLIEDVKISGVQIIHQGGGTREDAAYRPPEYEDMYPEPNMFTGGPRPNGRAPDGSWIPEGAPRPAAAPVTGRGAAPAPAAPARGNAPAAPAVRHNMPSHGFYLRHVKGIQFSDIEIRAAKDDLRPAFVLDDVHDADFSRVSAPQVAGAPIFALHDVSNFAARTCSGVADVQLPSVQDKTL